MPPVLIICATLVVLVLAVAVVMVLASRQPDSFEVRRSTVINAPPSRIYPLIDDFHNWFYWSPWEALDPTMARQFEGPKAGLGAAYGWDSKKAGSGKMVITEVRQDQLVLIDLGFTKPFKANNIARFDLAAEGANTAVTWSMTGKSPFISKVMGSAFSMDRMVGGDFEKGLAALKNKAELAG
jgi:hypothetical protein